jgi:hypothetical protein
LPLLTLVFLYYFARKYFSADVAACAAFLYVLMPFQYLVYSTFVFGLHNTVDLFTIILFLIFFSIFFTPSLRDVYFGRPCQRGSVKLHLLFLLAGFLSGVAAYTCYSFFASLLVMGVFWFIADMYLWKRRYVYLFLASFSCVFGIWIVFSFLQGWNGFFLYLHEKAGTSVSLLKLFLTKQANWFTTLQCLDYSIRDTFNIKLVIKLHSYAEPLFMPQNIFSNIIIISLIVSFYSSLRAFIRSGAFNPSHHVPLGLRQRRGPLREKSPGLNPGDECNCDFNSGGSLGLKDRRGSTRSQYMRRIKQQVEKKGITALYCKESVILLYCVLMIILYCLYPELWPTECYLYPAFPFLFLLIGILIAKLKSLHWGKITLRFCAYVVLIMVLVSGFSFYERGIDVFDNFDVGSYEALFTMKGYSLALLPHCFMRKWMPHDFLIADLFVSCAERETIKNVFKEVLSAWVPSEGKHNWYSINKEYNRAQELDPKLQPYLYILLGITIGDGLHREMFPSLRAQINSYVPKEFHHALYEGIAISLGNRRFREVLELFQSKIIDFYIPQNYRHYFYVELGRRIGERYKKNPLTGISLCSGFSSEFFPQLYLGLFGALPQEQLMSLGESKEPVVSALMREYIYFSYGRNVSDSFEGQNEEIFHQALEHVPLLYRPFCIEGAAYEIYEKKYREEFSAVNYSPIKLLENSIPKVVKNVNDEYTSALLYQGLGIGFGEKMVTSQHSPEINVTLSRLIPEKYITSFLKGYKHGNTLRYGQDKVKISTYEAIVYAR